MSVRSIFVSKLRLSSTNDIVYHGRRYNFSFHNRHRLDLRKVFSEDKIKQNVQQLVNIFKNCWNVPRPWFHYAGYLSETDKHHYRKNCTTLQTRVCKILNVEDLDVINDDFEMFLAWCWLAACYTLPRTAFFLEGFPLLLFAGLKDELVNQLYQMMRKCVSDGVMFRHTPVLVIRLLTTIIADRMSTDEVPRKWKSIKSSVITEFFQCIDLSQRLDYSCKKFVRQKLDRLEFLVQTRSSKKKDYIDKVINILRHSNGFTQLQNIQRLDRICYAFDGEVNVTGIIKDQLIKIQFGGNGRFNNTSIFSNHTLPLSFHPAIVKNAKNMNRYWETIVSFYISDDILESKWFDGVAVDWVARTLFDILTCGMIKTAVATCVMACSSQLQPKHQDWLLIWILCNISWDTIKQIISANSIVLPRGHQCEAYQYTTISNYCKAVMFRKDQSEKMDLDQVTGILNSNIDNLFSLFWYYFLRDMYGSQQLQLVEPKISQQQKVEKFWASPQKQQRLYIEADVVDSDVVVSSKQQEQTDEKKDEEETGDSSDEEETDESDSQSDESDSQSDEEETDDPIDMDITGAPSEVAFSVAASVAMTTVSMRLNISDLNNIFESPVYHDIDPSKSTNHMVATQQIQMPKMTKQRESTLGEPNTFNLLTTHKYMVDINTHYQPNIRSTMYIQSHTICWHHDQFYHSFTQQPINALLGNADKIAYWDKESQGVVSIEGVYGSFKDYVIAIGNKHQSYQLILDPICNLTGDDGKLKTCKDVLKVCYKNGCNLFEETFPILDVAKHKRINMIAEVWCLSAIPAKVAAEQAGKFLLVDFSNNEPISMKQQELPTERAITSKLVLLQECQVMLFVCCFFCFFCARIISQICARILFFLLLFLFFLFFNRNFKICNKEL